MSDINKNTDSDKRELQQKAFLKKLNIPQNLKGKKYLEIGCQDGLICFEAKKRNANLIVGIDKNQEKILVAKERQKNENLNIEFIHVDDYLDFNQGKYDIILARLQLQDIEKPIQLFQNIYHLLTEQGSLILECDVNDQAGRTMLRALSSDRNIIYPSMETLTELWLSQFVTRQIGKSPKEKSDPINRYIFHCKKRKSTVIFIIGDGGIGKTSLSYLLSNNAVVIHTDNLFNAKINEDDNQISEGEKKYLEAKQKYKNSIKRAWEATKKDSSVLDFFIDTISKAVMMNQGVPLVIVEGYVLNDIIKKIEKQIDGLFNVWVISKGEFPLYKNKFNKLFKNFF